MAERGPEFLVPFPPPCSIAGPETTPSTTMWLGAQESSGSFWEGMAVGPNRPTGLLTQLLIIRDCVSSGP